MVPFQAYLTALSGFVITCTVILTGNARGYARLFECLTYLFLIQIVFYCVRILSLPFPKSQLLSGITFSGFIICDSIYAGCFAAFCLIRLAMTSRAKKFDMFLFPKILVLYKLLKCSTATVFAYSSIASIFFYQRSLQFFTVSGYPAAFFIFIITLELVCSFGLLFRRTVLYSGLFLLCDMVGAVYTHYHNYFVSHIPGPLGKSIPSLIIQTTLISIILIALNPRITSRTVNPNS